MDAHGIMQRDPVPGLVDLGPGYLDPRLVPAELIGRWTAEALDRWGASVLGYGADAGPWPLRALAAARIGCTPSQVIVTGGTSAAMDQLAMRFSGEGRTVLTESLSYDLGRKIFTGWGVETLAVPGPADDIDVAEFAHAVKRATWSAGVVPAIYLIPTFHNPTGRTLSTVRRREFLAMAEHTGALIIEDHAYSELYFQSPPPPALRELARDPEQVISLYSLAKCLAPGLRLGWLAGGERLVAALEASPVRVSGGGPNHFTAMAVMTGMDNGELDVHVDGLRGELRTRRDRLVSALRNGLPPGFTVSLPAGGFFLWIGLPAGVHDDSLLQAAERAGLSFAAGSRFGGSADAVRLCFAGCPVEQISLGAAKFIEICSTATGS